MNKRKRDEASRNDKDDDSDSGGKDSADGKAGREGDRREDGKGGDDRGGEGSSAEQKGRKNGGAGGQILLRGLLRVLLAKPAFLDERDEQPGRDPLVVRHHAHAGRDQRLGELPEIRLSADATGVAIGATAWVVGRAEITHAHGAYEFDASC